MSSKNESGQVLGLLMEYIESGSSSLDLSSLEIASIPRTRKEEWDKQINENLQRLRRKFATAS